MRRSPLAVFVVASGLLVAACGGGSKTAATTAATDAPTTTTTSKSTTTSTTVGTTTSTVATSTTYIGAGLHPLTGRPDAEASVLNRPALVVKINNHPLAWPQTGLNQADIVFEELVARREYSFRPHERYQHHGVARPAASGVVGW